MLMSVIYSVHGVLMDRLQRRKLPNSQNYHVLRVLMFFSLSGSEGDHQLLEGNRKSQEIDS